MAFADVLPYFRQRMTALSYTKEHEDGFNFDNIGSTVLHNSYHLELGSFSGLGVDHGCQMIEVPVALRLFRRGYRKPWTARDEALVDAQTIIEDIAKHENAIDSASVHVVTFDSMDMGPIDDSNDNSFILVLAFTASVVIKLN